MVEAAHNILNDAAPAAVPRPRKAGLEWSALVGLSMIAYYWFALELTTGRYGWPAAASVSPLGGLALPLGTLAWVLRRRGGGKVLATVLVYVAVHSDVVLYHMTVKRPHYAAQIMGNPALVAAWAGLWALWQLLALTALISPPPWTTLPRSERN
jgi:hypothetical protein